MSKAPEIITFDGNSLTISQWASKIGLPCESLRVRLKRCGWSVEKALSLPNQRTQWECQKTKRCARCKQIKSAEMFKKTGRVVKGIRLLSYCAECEQNRMATYRQNIRLGALAKYSPETIKCALCLESRTAVLEIDHINGDGKKDRDRFSNTHQFYLWLNKMPVQKGYRVLCRNCNWIEHLKSKQWGCEHKQDERSMKEILVFN